MSKRLVLPKDAKTDNIIKFRIMRVHRGIYIFLTLVCVEMMNDVGDIEIYESECEYEREYEYK